MSLTPLPVNIFSVIFFCTFQIQGPDWDLLALDQFCPAGLMFDTPGLKDYTSQYTLMGPTHVFLYTPVGLPIDYVSVNCAHFSL